MCTVSWLIRDDGYELFCNRDEKRTRKRALPPRLDTRDGVRFLAPADGDFGGTWIATNEFGVTLCLLNGPGEQPASPRSRGLLVLDLASSLDLKEAVARLKTAGLERYAPFTLAMLRPGDSPVVVEWTGRGRTILAIAEPSFMLTSSSFDGGAVRAHRREVFAAIPKPASAEALLAYHGSHGDGPSAYSTCMHRSDAQTVSFTRINVTAAGTEMLYRPAALCQPALEQRHLLQA